MLYNCNHCVFQELLAAQNNFKKVQITHVQYSIKDGSFVAKIVLTTVYSPQNHTSHCLESYNIITQGVSELSVGPLDCLVLVALVVLSIICV